MKFVRWLGAFGAYDSVEESAAWEQSQVERQVAAEPLYRERSFIAHAKIGLEIAHPEVSFRRGWLADAFTEIETDGTIRASRRREVEYKNMDRFLAAWNKSKPFHHGEAAFSTPLYASVVVKSTISDRGMRRAKRISSLLNLPIKRIKG